MNKNSICIDSKVITLLKIDPYLSLKNVVYRSKEKICRNYAPLVKGLKKLLGTSSIFSEVSPPPKAFY